MKNREFIRVLASCFLLSKKKQSNTSMIKLLTCLFALLTTLNSCVNLSYPNSMRIYKSIDPRLVLYKQEYQNYWQIGGIYSIEEDSMFYPVGFSRFDAFGVNDRYLIVGKCRANQKVKYKVYSYQYFFDINEGKWIYNSTVDSVGLYSTPDSLGLPINSIKPLEEWLK